MAVRICDDEREVYNFAIQYHIGVADLKEMLREQGFFRKPYVIVCTLRDIRYQRGLISDKQYQEELRRDMEKAEEFKRKQALQWS